MTGPDFAEVDIDLLADYLGGALDGTPDEAVVAALVAGDPAWRSAHDTLTGGMAAVETSLRAIGAHAEPMPADLVVRLEQALAASPGDGDPASDHRLVGADAGTQPHGEPSRPRHLSAVPETGVPAGGSRSLPGRSAAAERRPRRLRWAAPAAAAAGVIAFAGFGIDHVTGDRDGTESTAGSAVPGAAAEPAAPMADDTGSGRLAEAPPNARIGTSGADYREATLAEALSAQATDEVRTRSGAPEIAGPGVTSALARLRVRAALLDCLDAVARDTGAGPITVQSVDYARYRDEPAVIVRFTAAGGETWVQASGPACGTRGGDSARLARVRVG